MLLSVCSALHYIVVVTVSIAFYSSSSSLLWQLQPAPFCHCSFKSQLHLRDQFSRQFDRFVRPLFRTMPSDNRLFHVECKRWRLSTRHRQIVQIVRVNCREYHRLHSPKIQWSSVRLWHKGWHTHARYQRRDETRCFCKRARDSIEHALHLLCQTSRGLAGSVVIGKVP